MSGPNPPGGEFPEGADLPGQEPGASSDRPQSSEPDTYSQAYSAPESEQFTSGPYVPADSGLYDYDSYEPQRTRRADRTAAVAMGSRGGGDRRGHRAGGVRVGSGDPNRYQQPRDARDHEEHPAAAPPVQDEITTTPPPPPPPPPTTEPPPPPPETVTVTQEPEPPPPPPPAEPPPPPPETAAPPPPPTTRAGPRQVTYSVTGTKAPGDIITVTYIDASGRSRTQRNVYIPWSLTVTPISQSEVGSVQASSLFLVSRLNCSITTSDGTVLSSNTNNSAQTAC